MKIQFLLGLNESDADSFSTIDISSFLNQTERALFNNAYFDHYGFNRGERKPKTYQKTQFTTSVLQPFERRAGADGTVSTNATGFRVFPDQATQHITQIGVIRDNEIFPVKFLRFNDLNTHLNNFYLKPRIDDVNGRHRFRYITEKEGDNNGVRIFPNNVVHQVVFDYLVQPRRIAIKDLTSDPVVTDDIDSQFPELTHDYIVKEAISLYKLSVGELAQHAAEERISETEL